ncbi:20S proteasome subunit (alpha or beta) [Halovivax ruber XH-70]|uniref:Proteasome subunit alpha n=1 Tax=Halovivax ruber (strain DSM 18193 / JCM 13892 / XH-70) TaxID=797302 RepID=L0IEU9_HALRX|nr:archaeal proteasome endopeptidase complex subunit alpha [Halovivax ruber]AGB16746.1 20S proteasome subunit (alpha or beta) [Halovivax ruber XH-70]
MDDTRRQAYDRGQTIFSPDGRLYQVEYAREAVERGSPAVGVRVADGVVLAARKRRASPLLEPDSVAKLHRIDDHISIASAGHAADARQLVDRARVAAQRHRLQYGEPAPVESVTTSLADHIQESTQTGGTRPYGTALLIAGIDPNDAGESTAQSAAGSVGQLFELDPSGTPYGWRAVGIGEGSTTIRETFESALDPATADIETTVDDAVPTALDGLAVDDDEPDPDAYECLTIEPGPTVTTRSTDEIETVLRETAS